MLPYAMPVSRRRLRWGLPLLAIGAVLLVLLLAVVGAMLRGRAAVREAEAAQRAQQQAVRNRAAQQQAREADARERVEETGK